MDRNAAFTALRTALRQAQAPAQTPSARLATGLPVLDATLTGGIPRSGITSIEGRLGSGRSWLVAALLRQATSEGFAALLELPRSSEGRLAPPALAQAGVALGRLIGVHPTTPLGIMRAAEWLMRSGSLRLVALPSLGVRQALWHRLAHVAQECRVAVVVHGTARPEVQTVAQVRLASQLQSLQFAGTAGPLGNVAAVRFELSVLKQRYGRSGQTMVIEAIPFAHAWSAPEFVREHVFATEGRRQHANTMRS